MKRLVQDPFGSYNILIASSYLSKMYSGGSSVFQNVFVDINTAKYQHDRDIGVSEIFAHFAAAYHMRHIKLKPSEAAPSLFVNQQVAEHIAQLEEDLPNELKLFFDEIQMATPKGVRQVSSRIRTIESPKNRITPSLREFETYPTAGKFFETSL